MLFSSNIFIFFFLPAVLLVYYALKPLSRTAQNVFLCFASLFFYAWGEPRFVLVMMLSICVNWAFGLLVDKYRDSKPFVKWLIAFDVAVNIGIIFIFKYLMFTLTNINALFHSHITVPEIALPIGISFFTFQALSYVLDVYREKGEAQKNILNVGLYISFFPQLIAGPIVRYETIAKEIRDRKENLKDFSDGIVRFIIGLGKKVIIANNMALIADQAFAYSAGSGTWFGVSFDPSVLMCWLGALAYTFQIFFDFSGYSDMAIGLGRMFGFHFMENFNYPYISKSATEFWRRWHISLSTWFRDYIYIPLGGSRVKTKSRHIFNLFVVWLCTGVWHGANWTFIAWGMMYFVLLVFEKSTGLDKDSEKRSVNVIRYIYTMFFVVMGWVLFRADSISDAFVYIGHMFGVYGNGLIDDAAVYHLTQYGAFFAMAVIFSIPVVRIVKDRFAAKERSGAVRFICGAVSGACILAIFVCAVSYIVIGSYNPFIYFNF